MFQSSPAPKGRCYNERVEAERAEEVSILTGPEGPVLRQCWLGRFFVTASFNPHRPRRAGATRACAVSVFRDLLFQSSPAPKGRCYSFLPRNSSEAFLIVSILTGPEGPVLLDHRVVTVGHWPVSILTGPEGPVLQSAHVGMSRGLKVSILTGPEGPVLRSVSIERWLPN